MALSQGKRRLLWPLGMYLLIRLSSSKLTSLPYHMVDRFYDMKKKHTVFFSMTQQQRQCSRETWMKLIMQWHSVILKYISVMLYSWHQPYSNFGALYVMLLSLSTLFMINCFLYNIQLSCLISEHFQIHDDFKYLVRGINTMSLRGLAEKYSISYC